MATRDRSPRYGNWVSPQLIAVPGVCALLLLFALGIAGATMPLAIAVLAVATILAAASLYFAYARFRFSMRGGDLQGRIQRLILDRLDWSGDGRALDIGCGNGRLAIDMAKMFPNARVVGVDVWGGGWGYARAACEHNAAIEGVDDRVSFEQASAARLPFPDGSFDLVVSNLTFHEVRGVPDKRQLVKEALRVLRPGGRFVLQDLLRLRRFYGSRDDLLRQVRAWGAADVAFVDTGRSPFIPRPLRLPFMVGTLAMLLGRKQTV